jgi:uncharacterized protein
VGLDLSIRSIHAGAETEARLLRVPLLWRDHVIGWTNLTMKNGALHADPGYVHSRPPKDRAFQRELDAELARIRFFLGLRT